MNKQLICSKFKEVLEDLKIRDGLNYEKLAAVWDKKKTFISQMANGYTLPKREVVNYLSDKYNINPDYIFRGANEMYGNPAPTPGIQIIRTTEDKVDEGETDPTTFLVSKVTKTEAMLETVMELLVDMVEKDPIKAADMIAALTARVIEKEKEIKKRDDKTSE